ncbi:beta-defensin 128 [Camelus dromedarius]|uniref:Beta-defensin n=2 Tax=Camelus TaxID=9836 RepID=A0A8B8RLA6_CAMFR|nr:beta-defensin 128 [Camelus dromedarius]XP_032317939.1 beta-defensin 128 [Camelus ferus]XP_045377050.1 beta-defensin 128 [Camelus bactrianus]
MKLFLVLIILLFEVSKDAARPRKCFNNVAGYCKKKCDLGEVFEVACSHRKLCCVYEADNRKAQEAAKLPEPPLKPDLKLDYIILPTVTLDTVTP